MPVCDEWGWSGDWVYSIYPQVNAWSDGTLEPKNHAFEDNGLTELRGSSQAIPWKDGYLGVSHEVEFTNTGRHYYHRFVYFDDNCFATSASEPFYFLFPGIEFANGIAVWRGNVVVSFGHEDERALLAVVPGHLL